MELVVPAKLQEYLEAIEAELYRFLAIDPPTLRAAVSAVTGR